MRIINITEEGRFGGPSKRIIEVAKGLKEYGVETIAVFPKEDSSKFQKLSSENEIEFHTLSMHRLTKDPWPLFKYCLFFFYELFQLVRYFQKIKPDLVHCNGSWQIKGVIASKLSGIPSVWHMNDTFAPRPVKIMFNLVAKYFSHSFVAASQRTADYYFSKNKKIKIFPAPIETALFYSDIVEANTEIRALKGIKVVTVGNINPVKGYETLIEAVRLVNQVFKDPIHFFAIGLLLDNQTKLINELKAKKEKYGLHNFYFYGASNEIKEILKAADIYVCSSDFESSPISIWEAMSMGKPIISTDVGDVVEIFKKFNCGIVVPTKSPQLLADQIIKLSRNPNRFVELGTAARATAVNYFDIKICVKNHFDIYTEAIDK